jgi:regulator of protease activity HflC (stomatin/prohibitin superfamily)
MALRLLLLATVAQFLTACGCETVDTGHRGIRTTFGEVQGEPLAEGLYWYNPFTSHIVELSVREEKIEGKTACFTRDTQTVTVAYVLTYYPDPTKIHELYKQFGEGWEEKILTPAILGSLKDVVGQYIADDLVGKREAVKSAVYEELKTALAARSVTITRLDLVNLDFDNAYEQAVEAKVVAIQKSAEAKNKTVQVEEQAKQKVISAKAEAESMQIRSQALQQNKGLVEYEAVQKWDGKLPVYSMGQALPFINLTPKGG